jgi:toxin FitB
LIILDTNVVSELMKPAPYAAVIDWLDLQSRRDLSTTSITKAEVLYGVARLPEGRRKAALATEAERMFRDDLPAPLFPF